MTYADKKAAALAWWRNPTAVTVSTASSAVFAVELALQERETAARLTHRLYHGIYATPTAAKSQGAPSWHNLQAIRARVLALAQRFVCRDTAILASGRRTIPSSTSDLGQFSFEELDIALSDHPLSVGPDHFATDWDDGANDALTAFLLNCRHWLLRFRLVDISDFCYWKRKHTFFKRDNSLYPSYSENSDTYEDDGAGDGRHWAFGQSLSASWEVTVTNRWVPAGNDYAIESETNEEEYRTLYSGAILQNPVPIPCDISVYCTGPFVVSAGFATDAWFYYGAPDYGYLQNLVYYVRVYGSGSDFSAGGLTREDTGDPLAGNYTETWIPTNNFGAFRSQGKTRNQAGSPWRDLDATSEVFDAMERAPGVTGGYCAGSGRIAETPLSNCPAVPIPSIVPVSIPYPQRGDTDNPPLNDHNVSTAKRFLSGKAVAIADYGDYYTFGGTP